MTDKKPTILFDFDGTLAETMMLVFSVFNQLAPVYKYSKLTEAEIEDARHLTMAEFVQYVKVPRWKLPVIAIHARSLMHHRIHEVLPPEGLVSALTEIHASDKYQMHILTSNNQKNVSAFLKEHKIGWFDEIHATRSLLSKRRRLAKYVKEKGIKAEDLFYIGDTTIDVVSAGQVGIKTVAVTWGLNTSEALARANPDFLIDHPSELTKIFLQD